MKTSTPFNENVTNVVGSSNCNVAWSAIIAGAVTATTVSLIMLLLGAGLGLTSVSPWSGSGISIGNFTLAAAIWLVFIQLISSGLAGYLTGRLRGKWFGMHIDEVYFRDTAHGFLAWALATIITAAFLTSAVSSAISGGVKAATAVSAGAVAGAGYAASKNSNENMGNPTKYLVDSLYRSENSNPLEGNIRTETMRILINDFQDGNIKKSDKSYLVQRIAAHAGITPEEASQRIEEVTAKLTEIKQKAKQELEEARKITMKVAIYTFLSMLMGAFIASFAAALGGRHRDI